MEGKNYVCITGATSGIGKACAQLLAKQGYNLLLTGRRLERLLELKQLLESSFPIEIRLSCFDVRSEAEVKQAAETLEPEVKHKLTILINNAGLAVGRGPVDEGLTDDWNRMIDTNVKGLLYVTRYFVPFIKQNGGGHIVNIASIAGKEVYPGGNVYCASKHAVDALSKAMRIDLLPHHIKVTNIAPGAVETEFSLVRFKGDQAIADSIYTGYEPLIAEDVAEAIVFVLTRPRHVNINDLVIMPSAQANSTTFLKD